jgi:5-methylcytosine-specific restriction endonuclease McrA
MHTVQQLRAIITQIPLGTYPCEHPHGSTLLGILQDHPVWGPRKMTRFRLGVGRKNSRARLLQVQYLGRWILISWRRAASNFKEPLSLPSALRSAVRRQITAWRTRHRLNSACSLCGATGPLHVDHCLPTFLDLTTSFLSTRTAPDDFLSYRWGKKFKPRDRKFSADWQAYHRRHANLRWLCRTCNLRRGKRVLNNQ